MHYLADLQLVHGLRCYGSIMRILVTSLFLSCDENINQQSMIGIFEQLTNRNIKRKIMCKIVRTRNVSECSVLAVCLVY